MIDATCPLVTKVHLEALKFAREKRTIILIGHHDHQEIVGTSGEAPDRTIVVDSVAAVDALEVEDPEKLSFLTQTTLSLYDTQEIVARLGKISRLSRAQPATTSATPRKTARKPSNKSPKTSI